MNYYYGMWPLEFDLATDNGADKVVSQMGINYEFVFQNGSTATTIATFTAYNASIRLQTDNENMVGTQRTIVRACDSLLRLIELNEYLNISDNQAP